MCDAVRVQGNQKQKAAVSATSYLWRLLWKRVAAGGEFTFHRQIILNRRTQVRREQENLWKIQDTIHHWKSPQPKVKWSHLHPKSFRVHIVWSRGISLSLHTEVCRDHKSCGPYMHEFELMDPLGMGCNTFSLAATFRGWVLKKKRWWW